MALREVAPEDLIESSWLKKYKQNIEALWWQLVRLNSSIFVLEKMFAFPFDLFQPPPPPRHFWNLTEIALFEACVMIVWRVAVDNSFGEGLTLQQLKNEIFQHLREENHRDQFRKALKEIGFESATSTFRPKIKEIRHNYIAHFNLGRRVNPTPEQIRQRTLLFSELKKCCDTLNSFFDLLCFSHQRAVLPIEYHPDVLHPAGVDRRSDVELLLDSLARDSFFLRFPEEDPDFWSLYRKNLTERQIETLNQYRAKFGLPGV